MYLNDEFSFVVLCPLRSFSANSKGARALYLHNSIFCLGFVTKVPPRYYMPYRHEEEKHWEEYRVEMGFSCAK